MLKDVRSHIRNTFPPRSQIALTVLLLEVSHLQVRQFVVVLDELSMTQQQIEVH